MALQGDILCLASLQGETGGGVRDPKNATFVQENAKFADIGEAAFAAGSSTKRARNKAHE